LLSSPRGRSHVGLVKRFATRNGTLFDQNLVRGVYCGVR
jgi:hypothetical protein